MCWNINSESYIFSFTFSFSHVLFNHGASKKKEHRNEKQKIINRPFNLTIRKYNTLHRSKTTQIPTLIERIFVTCNAHTDTSSCRSKGEYKARWRQRAIIVVLVRCCLLFHFFFSLIHGILTVTLLQHDRFPTMWPRYPHSARSS